MHKYITPGMRELRIYTGVPGKGKETRTLGRDRRDLDSGWHVDCVPRTVELAVPPPPWVLLIRRECPVTFLAGATTTY